ncbi:DUF6886 family protein [Nocardia sp. NPDC051463]|uniref:DUF6886 family protein n=1 Tax=Nocardia sp. NPDC051463 TaxID=3154845 RepID=UPI00341756DE
MHFSEDPTIRRFVPRDTATPQPEVYVWAADAPNAPSYWFPRNSPRAWRGRRRQPPTSTVTESSVTSSVGFGGIRLRGARPRP